MTKKFMTKHFEGKGNPTDFMKLVEMIRGRKLGKTSRVVDYSEQLEVYRGLETGLTMVEDDHRDFDLMMSCGPYGDED